MSLLFICFWIDLVRLLATTKNTSAVADYTQGENSPWAICVYKYMKIQGPRFQRNYIIARDQKSDFNTWHIISIIAENKSYAHNKTHLHTVEAYNTILLILRFFIFFRPLSSFHLLQSNQSFQAIEFVDRHISEKL